MITQVAVVHMSPPLSFRVFIVGPSDLFGEGARESYTHRPVYFVPAINRDQREPLVTKRSFLIAKVSKEVGGAK